MEKIWRVGKSTGLSFGEASALAESTGGVAELDPGRVAEWYRGMADAAYGCGDSLAGASYAQGAWELAAKAEGK